jgi:hypothetical protein
MRHWTFAFGADQRCRTRSTGHGLDLLPRRSERLQLLPSIAAPRSSASTHGRKRRAPKTRVPMRPALFPASGPRAQRVQFGFAPAALPRQQVHDNIRSAPGSRFCRPPRPFAGRPRAATSRLGEHRSVQHAQRIMSPRPLGNPATSALRDLLGTTLTRRLRWRPVTPSPRKAGVATQGQRLSSPQPQSTCRIRCTVEHSHPTICCTPG